MEDVQRLSRLIRAGDLDRRSFLKLAAAMAIGVAVGGELPAARGQTMAPRQMARFPEKTDLILLTDRPPQLETPIKYFREDLTPNEAFFVRWHLSGIPTRVDTRTFRLSVAGHVDKALSLSVEQLKADLEAVSVVAVAQCSGNSRAFFEPRVTGGQWGHGAVGNAKWTGVRLKDLLQHAGVKEGALEVSFGGLDQPPYPGPERFVKSLELARAMDADVTVAYAMNDAPLPMLNGFPLRLVVPGWYATYWVKGLNEINVLKEKFGGFWMAKAYRIPKNENADESPEKLATETVPINRHSVRSIFVQPEGSERMRAGEKLEVQGVAFDAGDGIRRVEVSVDGGKNWADARLAGELGKYAWRRWRFDWKPMETGRFTLMSRATNAKGETQTTRQWNRSGYQRNVIEHVEVNVA